MKKEKSTDQAEPSEPTVNYLNRAQRRAQASQNRRRSKYLSKVKIPKPIYKIGDVILNKTIIDIVLLENEIVYIFDAETEEEKTSTVTFFYNGDKSRPVFPVYQRAIVKHIIN